MLNANWSARVEWLYIDLGNVASALSTAGSIPGVQTTVWSRSESYNEVRFGIDYKFAAGR
jgi:opacity protein-like surface antigen